MAKSCLGIDIGKDQLKLVLMKGETIQKAVSVQMPEGLLKEGRIVSVETTGELIRKTMKGKPKSAAKKRLLWCLQESAFSEM